MVRLGYLRARRKQEIDEFEREKNLDGLFVDLINEYGVTATKEIEALMEQIKAGDVVVIRSLSEIADEISDLRQLLATLQEKGAALELANSTNDSLLTSVGYELLTVLNDFLNEKKRLKELKQRKLGRPAPTYPIRFREVYTLFRNGRLTQEDAAIRLGVGDNKFREMVKIFEA